MQNKKTHNSLNMYVECYVICVSNEFAYQTHGK